LGRRQLFELGGVHLARRKRREGLWYSPFGGSVSQTQRPCQRFTCEKDPLFRTGEVQFRLLIDGLLILEVEVRNVLRSVLLERNLCRRLRSGGARACQCHVLGSCNELVVRRAHVRCEAEHFRADGHLGSVECSPTQRATPWQLDQFDERLRKTQLIRPIRIAREADLELENGIRDRAGLDQIRTRNPYLRECRLQSRIVDQRDRHRFVGGEIVAQHRSHTLVVDGRWNGSPFHCRPGSLPDRVLNIGYTRIARNSRARSE
jgi:hypothetical protein